MATLVKTIKSRSTGDIIYPVTKADAVYFNDNNNLVSVQGKINTIQGLLGSSSISNVGSSITGIIGNETLTTTAQTLAGAINEHQTDISTLDSKLTYLTKTWDNSAEITTSSGTIQAGIVSMTYNSKTIILNGRIRVKDPIERPTITINGVPSNCPNFSLYGSYAMIRFPSSTAEISDTFSVNHINHETKISLQMDNYIGRFPSTVGGYAVFQFNIVKLIN